MTVILRRVRGTAAAVVASATLWAVMSGVLASRAAAQTVPIPMVTQAKAAANKAAAASNAQTAGMQAVGDASPATTAGSTTTTTSVTHVRTTTVTPISASASQAPQQKQPVKSTASTAPSASPIKPVLSVGSTPARTAVSVTSATVPAPTGATVAGKAAVAAGPPSDSGAQSISVTQRGTKGEVSLNREVFSYDPGARRDPFVSLMRSGELRPMLSDLRLVTVLYDPTGQNSIAVMHDLSTKDQYRVRVGQTLGRMRVAQIQPKQVVFTVEEVGFSRQEALALGDTTKARMQ